MVHTSHMTRTRRRGWAPIINSDPASPPTPRAAKATPTIQFGLCRTRRKKSGRRMADGVKTKALAKPATTMVQMIQGVRRQ